MTVKRADVVVSTAGHDKGQIFFVLEEDGTYAYLVDGKTRKIENPKRKKIKHLKLSGVAEGRTAERLRSGEKPGNRELRTALKEFRAADFGEMEVCKHG